MTREEVLVLVKSWAVGDCPMLVLFDAMDEAQIDMTALIRVMEHTTETHAWLNFVRMVNRRVYCGGSGLHDELAADVRIALYESLSNAILEGA